MTKIIQVLLVLIILLFTACKKKQEYEPLKCESGLTKRSAIITPDSSYVYRIVASDSIAKRKIIKNGNYPHLKTIKITAFDPISIDLGYGKTKFICPSLYLSQNSIIALIQENEDADNSLVIYLYDLDLNFLKKIECDQGLFFTTNYNQFSIYDKHTKILSRYSAISGELIQEEKNIDIYNIPDYSIGTCLGHKKNGYYYPINNYQYIYFVIDKYSFSISKSNINNMESRYFCSNDFYPKQKNPPLFKIIKFEYKNNILIINATITLYDGSKEQLSIKINAENNKIYKNGAEWGRLKK